jgi:hypothetical protein
MLVGMDILAAVRAFRRRPAATPPVLPPGRRDHVCDDLAEFLEHPPGSLGARTRPGDGWAPLSAPVPGPAAGPGRTVARPGRTSRRVLAATAALALLVGAAATLVVLFALGFGAGRNSPPGHDTTATRRDLEAHLVFGGVILERRAVGVTATYPELRLSGDGTGRRAEVELPTWNCLTDDAPADPEAAGCRRSLTEYGELTSPDLQVSEDGGELRISGRFPTVTRPNGSPSAPTGRTYELVVTVDPGDGAGAGRRPVTGLLRLGEDDTRTTGSDVAAGINVLRYDDRAGNRRPKAGN